jgi:hypothetical protein
MGQGWKPPEAEAIQFMRERGLQGRMLTYFDWGEYAIWHMAPALRVSMDGRRETVYSERVIADHVQVYLNQPGAETIVGAMKPDYVWLPAQAGILSRLEHRGWQAIFRGPISTILAAKNIAPATAASVISGARAPRCFPGP